MTRKAWRLEPREIGLVAAAGALVADQGTKLFMLHGAGFAQMALRCVQLAQGLCGGRLAFVLEGGYATAELGLNAVSVLDGFEQF